MAEAVDLQNASDRANQQTKADPSKLPQAQAAQQAFQDKDKEVKTSASAYLKLTAGWCAAANPAAARQSVLVLVLTAIPNACGTHQITGCCCNRAPPLRRL